MPNVCRVGDIGVGICYQHKHPTQFVTTFCKGDPITSANESQIITIGGLGRTSCGHVTMATTGSATVFGESDLAVHRVGDVGIVLGGGFYVAVSGSPNVFAGDEPPAPVCIKAPGVFMFQNNPIYDNSPQGQLAIRTNEGTNVDAPIEAEQRPYQSCDKFPEVITLSTMTMQVSRYFTLSTCKNIPIAQRGLTANQIACNWAALCLTILDPIRDNFNFSFNSGFRTVASGMGNTDHGLGCAADISCGSIEETIAMFKYLVASGLPYSQIIYEKHNSAWVHVSYRGKPQSDATRIMWTFTGSSPYGHGGLNGANLPANINPNPRTPIPSLKD